jgi:hypothetical protein
MSQVQVTLQTTLTVTGSLTVSGSSTFTNIGPAVFSGSITQTASTASFGGVVGIGTATPAAKLDVNGTFKVSNTSTFDNQATFNNANIVATGLNSQVGNFTINRAHSNTSVEILGGATSVKFDAGNGSASTMFLGKTSIAAAYITASAMLHVKSTGATSSTIALLIQNSAGTQSGYIDDSGQWMIGTGTNGGYRLDISGSTRIQGDTTIGLGTTGVINNLTFQSARGGAGLRAGIYWSSGASIINRRKFSGGNDNTLSFFSRHFTY